MFFYIVIGFGIILLLLFPIFIEGDLHYDINKNKCAFSVNFYKFFKIFGGYINSYPGGLALHKNKNSAILLPYENLNNERKRFSFLKTFRFHSLRATIESGGEYFFAIESLRRIYSFIRACNGRLEDTNIGVWLVGGDTLKISANIILYFNNFILIIDLIEFSWRKMKKIWQQKAKKSTI